ncbi:hypothetical protein IV203_017118 [Nitzschia inconspicua]|uniref:DUF6824 domain-containing protein n=1 Tax=Nitzschia inconspicua TaxID=303405 RepID=A0A9K3KR23_9STRA|nr:hypothetical protein IV203_017118 [Nitzschia inconspicua]
MILKRNPEVRPPEILEDVNPSFVDNLLSNELRQLDFKTRDEIQEEVHGVRKLARQETPELIETSLAQLQEEIDQIPQKDEYDEAQQYPQTYVNTEAFRLKMLRSELFNPKAAAIRLVKFLEFMKEYYGPELLTRPPRFSDLGTEELDLLKAGGQQILPCRDRSGRRIAIFIGGHGLGYRVYTRLKLDAFFAWQMSEDETDQKDGAILVTWATSETIDVQGDPEDRRESARFFACMPCRLVACHICIPREPVFRFLTSLILMTLGRDGRKATRVHSGTPTELLYALMTFGIPADQMPVTSTGTIKTKKHLQWLKFLIAKEAAELNGEEFDGINCPGVNDVLFSLGRQTWCHPGYAMFRGMLEAHYLRRNSSHSSEEKTAITWEIVEEVEQKGGRFLIRDSRGWWVQIKDRNVIRGKVALAFRNHNKRVLARNHCQEEESPIAITFGERDSKRLKSDGHCCVDFREDGCIF